MQFFYTHTYLYFREFGRGKDKGVEYLFDLVLVKHLTEEGGGKEVGFLASF